MNLTSKSYMLYLEMMQLHSLAKQQKVCLIFNYKTPQHSNETRMCSKVKQKCYPSQSCLHNLLTDK